MPISDAIHRVLYERLSPRDAVSELLAREPTRE
jgi:glycerol-3-phosphate dehydrogenase